MAKPSNPVGWFEIPVTDLARACAFYEKVFGFAMKAVPFGPVTMGWFPPMVNEAYGITGSLVQGPGYVPGKSGVRIYFTSPDIDGTLAKVAAAGGKVLLAKTSIGEYGTIAQFEDSEGNLIALHRAPDTMKK
jgi:predicted enzyme related to lactoylglutathione lyase